MYIKRMTSSKYTQKHNYVKVTVRNLVSDLKVFLAGQLVVGAVHKLQHTRTVPPRETVAMQHASQVTSVPVAKRTTWVGVVSCVTLSPSSTHWLPW